MNNLIKREATAIAYFFLFFLLLLIVVGIFFEFIFWPLLAWAHGAEGYAFPSIDWLYKWGKLIFMIVPFCSVAVWLYEKKTSGR